MPCYAMFCLCYAICTLCHPNPPYMMSLSPYAALCCTMLCYAVLPASAPNACLCHLIGKESRLNSSFFGCSCSLKPCLAALEGCGSSLVTISVRVARGIAWATPVLLDMEPCLYCILQELYRNLYLYRSCLNCLCTQLLPSQPSLSSHLAGANSTCSHGGRKW